jgi:hypothetical protein
VSDRKLTGKAVDEIKRCRQNDVDADKNEQTRLIVVNAYPEKPAAAHHHVQNIKDSNDDYPDN